MLTGVEALGVTIFSQYLAAHNQPRALVAAWAAGVGLGSVLRWLLIPGYGGVGAAATLSITYLFVALVVVVIGTRLHSSSTPASAVPK